MKKNVFFVLLITTLLLSACAPEAPKVGSIVKIPDETTAYQVKPDRTGLDSCSLPEQEVEVTRNTHWDTLLGSAGYDRMFISEITTSDNGDCDKFRSVFIEDETLNKLIK